MDDIERAENAIEQMLAAALSHPHRKVKLIEATGYCLNCGERMNYPEQKWCDSDCCSDWEKRNRER